MAANLDLEWEKGRERLSQSLRGQLERGRAATALDYQRACARIRPLNDGFQDIFERCAAIITPAAAGTAPRSLESTGDPAFCTLWTLCGMPSLSLPIMEGGNGLPLGVQLVGPREGDARLLRTARWLVSFLDQAGTTGSNAHDFREPGGIQAERDFARRRGARRPLPDGPGPLGTFPPQR